MAAAGSGGALTTSAPGFWTGVGHSDTEPRHSTVVRAQTNASKCPHQLGLKFYSHANEHQKANTHREELRGRQLSSEQDVIVVATRRTLADRLPALRSETTAQEFAVRASSRTCWPRRSSLGQRCGGRLHGASGHLGCRRCVIALA